MEQVHDPRPSVMRAYKFRLYPTSRQHTALNQMTRDHAEVYNAALQERRDAWKTRRTRVTASQQMGQLTEMRHARPDQAVWSYTSQQQTIRRLDKSMAAFFRRVKAGEKPGYPRFRASAQFDTVDFRYGDGIGFTHLAVTRLKTKPDQKIGSKQTLWHEAGLPKARKGGKREARLRIQGVGAVRVWIHRTIPEGSVLTAASIKREGKQWYFVLPVETTAKPRALTGAVVGVDLAIGKNGLGYTSDGERLPNPQPLRSVHTELKTAQRELARKKRGSTRYRKQSAKVARLHGKVARVRRDHLHKTAAALVGAYDFIAVEDLRIRNMTRRPKPKPNPDQPGRFLPNGAASKAGLNTSILDAGWGTFTLMLESKAACAGIEVVRVDPANTSRECNQCGHVAKQNRHRKRFRCLSCGHTTDADINAAKNILSRGLAQRESAADEAGVGLAPTQPTAA